MGILMSRELSVLQELLVSMNSASPDPIKGSNRIKMEVMVCAHLSSGSLNLAKTTALPECGQTLLARGYWP